MTSKTETQTTTDPRLVAVEAVINGWARTKTEQTQTIRRLKAQVALADLSDQLRRDADEMNGWGAGIEAEHARQAADELERLQCIIDNRPAINAGLPETYIAWSQSIYVMEYEHIQGSKQ